MRACVCVCVRAPMIYLFGGLAEDVPHAPAAAQAVTQHRHDAHEQGVAGALHAALLQADAVQICSDTSKKTQAESGGVRAPFTARASERLSARPFCVNPDSTDGRALHALRFKTPPR